MELIGINVKRSSKDGNWYEIWDAQSNVRVWQVEPDKAVDSFSNLCQYFITDASLRNLYRSCGGTDDEFDEAVNSPFRRS